MAILKNTKVGFLVCKRRTKNVKDGFTLIEVAVVILIIGIMLGMAIVNIGQNENQTLGEEAKRVALLLEMAHEEAMTTGEPLSWTFSYDGRYSFWRINDKGEWQVITNNGFFHTGSLDERVRLIKLTSAGIDLKSDDRILFPPTGNITPFEITLAMKERYLNLSANAIGKVSINGGE